MPHFKRHPSSDFEDVEKLLEGGRGRGTPASWETGEEIPPEVLRKLPPSHVPLYRCFFAKALAIFSLAGEWDGFPLKTYFNRATDEPYVLSFGFSGFRRILVRCRTDPHGKLVCDARLVLPDEWGGGYRCLDSPDTGLQPDADFHGWLCLAKDQSK